MIVEKRDVIDYTFFVLVCSVVFVRMFIWRFYSSVLSFEKTDLSNMVVAGVILIIAVLFLTKAILTDQKLKKSGFDLYVLGYIGVALISILYSVEQNLSLKSWLFLFSYIVYFYLLVNVLTTGKKVKIFMFFLVFCGLIIALWGFKDYIYLLNREPIPQGFEVTNQNKSVVYVIVNKRITSLLGWPNVLASFLMLFIPLSVTACFLKVNKALKVFAGFCSVAMLSAMVLTFSILGVLSFVAITILTILFFFYIRKKIILTRIQKRFLIISFVIGCLIFGFILNKRDIFNKTNSLKARKEYLQSTIAMIKERPISGFGFNTYQVANRPYISTKEGYSTFAHYSYLQIWSEIGILGLMCMIGLIAQVFRQGIKGMSFDDEQQKDTNIIIFGLLWGMAAFLTHNLFSFTLLKPNISFYWWVTLAMLCVLLARGQNEKEKDLSVVNNIQRIVLGVLMAGAILVLCRMYMAEKAYYDGIRAFGAKNYQLSLDKFKLSKEINPLDGQANAALGQLYYNLAVMNKDIKYIPGAIEETEIAIKKMPTVYQNYFTMGQILTAKGSKNQAKWYFNKAKSLASYKFPDQ